MAVEIYKSNGPEVYGSFEQVGYDLASFFHASAHFEIIDSYTTHWWSNYPTTPKTYGAHRYKGDPLTVDGSRGSLPVWDSIDDVGEAGDWLVVRCVTSIHPGLGSSLPPWECKAQWSAGYMDDVSDPTGTIYVKKPNADYTGRSRRVVMWRFCPWGGWDKADSLPDFRPQGRSYPASSQNHCMALGSGGSGNDTRWYMACDTGCFYRWSRRNQNAYDQMGFGGFIGDIRPTIAGRLPNPRGMIGSGAFSVFELAGTGGDGMLLCEESYQSNGYGDWSVDDSGGGMLVVDHNEELHESNYRLPTGWLIMANGLAVPNGQASNLEIDTFPFMPIMLKAGHEGVYYDVPQIRKGFGMGACLVANKQWVSTGAEYCAFLKWDGATALY